MTTFRSLADRSNIYLYFQIAVRFEFVKFIALMLVAQLFDRDETHNFIQSISC
jgi:hypothetical protein